MFGSFNEDSRQKFGDFAHFEPVSLVRFLKL